MDAAGAEMLAWRIEQHGHWKQAQSVLDGRQPASDPDRADLVSVGDGIRIYSLNYTHNGTGRLCKRLVNGVWEHGMIEEPSQSEEVSEPAAAAEIYGGGDSIYDVTPVEPSRPALGQIARIAY
jgi:hypothetical protein